ncbi:MAG: hypothetical protein M3461_20385 [Pseudomonadota bacterium]|nr:hypothetical protein [Pseudomonadota bacterium]
MVTLIGLVLQRRPGLAVRSSAAFLIVWMAVMLPWWALDYLRQHPGEAILTDVRKVVWLYGWHKVPRSFANSSPKWDAAEHRVVDVAACARRGMLYTVYWVPVLALFLWGLAQPITRAESAACLCLPRGQRGRRRPHLRGHPLSPGSRATHCRPCGVCRRRRGHEPLAVGTGAASPFDE